MRSKESPTLQENITRRDGHKKRVKTGVSVALHLLFALVFGVCFVAYLILQDRGLPDWGQPYPASQRFAENVSNTLRAYVQKSGEQELSAVWKKTPDSTPIPLGFSGWLLYQKLNYLNQLNAVPEQEKREAAENLLANLDFENHSVMPSELEPILYAKKDLESWAKTGLQKKRTEVLFTTTFDGYATTPDERSAFQQQMKEQGVEDDDFAVEERTLIVEDKKPLNVSSLLSGVKYEWPLYESMEYEVSDLLSEITAMNGVLEIETPDSNIQYQLRFLSSQTVYTNAQTTKRMTPIWSAEVHVLDGKVWMDKGKWAEEFTNYLQPMMADLFYPQDESIPLSDTQEINSGIELIFSVDTTLQVQDALAKDATFYPYAQKIVQIAEAGMAIGIVGWTLSLIFSLLWTSNEGLPLLQKLEGWIPIELLIVLSLGFGLGVLLLFSFTLDSIEGNVAIQLLQAPFRWNLWLLIAGVILVLDVIGWLLLSSFFRKARMDRFLRGSLFKEFFSWIRRLYLDYEKGHSAKHRITLLVFLMMGTGALVLLIGVLSNSFLQLVILGVIWALLFLRIAIRRDREDARILEAMQQITSGDIHVSLPVDSFQGVQRSIAAQINQFEFSLRRALEKSLKNERMQTELITNVSHDLRTPLTSIINYVDLLQDPNLSEAKREEYIKILDKKSQRLKVLMNDLIEVSKATSGAIEINIETIDLTEVMRQSLAEAETNWAPHALTPVIRLPENPIWVQADGQKLSRVLENLLNNAQKYSQAGSRVYIEVKQGEKEGIVTIKNMSRMPLNMTPEEKMERFRRADSSRSTEGSGLGLSIADQLLRHMNSQLILEIDGDLFKAEVRLPMEKTEL